MISIGDDLPIPFVEFQRRALYGPGGFYEHGQAGRRGDFLTSPEVGPLFGAVIARFVDERWIAAGRPDEFVVVDAGAGPATLLRALVAHGGGCAAAGALRPVAVEQSAAQRRQHPADVESSDRLPDGPFVGVIVANELLDNLPIRLCVFDGGWREAFVTIADGRPVEVLGAALDPRPPVLPATAPHGARAPLADVAAEWVTDAVGRLSAGSVVMFDYARATTAEFATIGWRDWLRTYRRHERGGHYLAAPGEQDITADVPLDQLPLPDEVMTQAEFLAAHGIDELVAEGRAGWAAGAAGGSLEALRMRSRVNEAAALGDPAGLGAFTVAIWNATP